MDGREGVGWGGLFPLNEAPRHYKTHPPIVAQSEMGGNGTRTGRGQAGGEWVGLGGLCRQTTSSCTRAVGQVMSGEGWIKQINT